jgi:hypothetical protein
MRPEKQKGHHPLRDDGLLETWKLFWLHHPQTPARASANSTDDIIVPGLRWVFTTVENHTRRTVVNVISCAPPQVEPLA